MRWVLCATFRWRYLIYVYVYLQLQKEHVCSIIQPFPNAVAMPCISIHLSSPHYITSLYPLTLTHHCLQSKSKLPLHPQLLPINPKQHRERHHRDTQEP